MKVITAIDPSWLPLIGSHHCKLVDPLVAPTPTYNGKQDFVYCLLNPTFSPYTGMSSHIERTLPAGEGRIKHAARLFLVGDVFPHLKTLKVCKPYLVCSNF